MILSPDIQLVKPQTLLITCISYICILAVDLGGEKFKIILMLCSFKNRPITWHLMQPRFYLRFLLLLLSKYTSALSENSLIPFSHAFNNALCSSL